MERFAGIGNKGRNNSELISHTVCTGTFEIMPCWGGEDDRSFQGSVSHKPYEPMSTYLVGLLVSE